MMVGGTQKEENPLICIEKLTSGNFRVDSLDTFLPPASGGDGMLAEDGWTVDTAAHRLCGCVEAQELIPAIAREEPFDVQMEYVL